MIDIIRMLEVMTLKCLIHGAVINSSIFKIYQIGVSITNIRCDITYNILFFCKIIFEEILFFV